MNHNAYDVVIATSGNRSIKSGSIRATLESIRQQTVQPLAIHVVNNGCASPSDTRWLRSICERHGAKYLEFAHANRAAARNRGMSQCRASYVVLADDDIVLAPGAAELALGRVSPQHFCCGARRRYVPMNVDLDKVRELVRTRNFQELDRLASDEQVAVSGYRQKFRKFPHQSTFIGCFGILPRRITSEITFDERYVGWGMEDTDYMRRLLHRLGFRSLSETTVWHIDHLVSPYIWADHWGKNFELYLEAAPEWGYLRLFELLQRNECRAKSQSVLLLDGSERKRHGVYPRRLSAQHRVALDRVRATHDKDRNTAAILLTGSALYKRSPRDLDVVRVTFAGDSRFELLNLGKQVELQTISIPSLEATLFHPEWFPDSWLWIAARYAEGSYYWTRVDVRTLALESIRATLTRRLCHLVTYHLGALIRCIRARTVPEQYEGLKHAAVILCLWRQEFPDRMRFPYARNKQTTVTLRKLMRLLKCRNVALERQICAELAQPVREIVQRGQLESSEQRIFLPDCAVGLEILKHWGWGNIPAVWERVLR
jgi:glycosyltransferase involved in cell wall biosynthesis